MKKLILLLVLLSPCFLHAQKVLSVATKTFTEKVPYDGKDLTIDVEKATVTISGWSNDYYQIEIKLISKHKNQEQAIAELDHMKYELENSVNETVLKNFFFSDEKFKKVQGILSAEFVVKAPNQTSINVKNRYGSTNIRGLESNLALAGQFVKTIIDNCSGSLSLEANFGSNQITNWKGDMDMDLYRVDILGRNISGKIEGESDYGSIQFEALKTEAITIDAKNTTINIQLVDPLVEYSYDLKTTFNSIYVGGTLDQTVKNEWKKSMGEKKISISTTYSPIVINQDQSLKALKK